MKKTILSISLLAGVLTFAQKKDSADAKNIDEVIINSVIKKDSEYSNKMPLKTIEDPQVLSSVSKTVLQNQSIFTVDDAYRNVTGLQKMWTATSRAGDGGSFVVLRGFSSNNSLRNGLVSPVTTTIDAINVEKIEVLKGPSGTLYGSNVASYGGIINRITKRPLQDFGGEVSLIGGSYNYYRAQADVNAPLTKDKKLLFRVNTAYTNTGTFQKENAKNQYTAFTPSLTYNANEKLQFNLEYERYDTRAIGEQFFFYLSPTTLNGIDNMRDLEKAGLNYKESYIGDDLYTTAEVNNVFGQINYKINDHIKSSTNINNSTSYSDGASPYFAVNYYNASKLYRVTRYDQSTRGSKSSYFQVQQNFNFDYNFANGMRNRTVVGVDFLQTSLKQRYVYLNSDFEKVPPAVRGDFYSNFNGTTLAAAYNIPGNTGIYNVDANTNTYSGYISNVFTPVEGLNLVLGGRYESNDFQGGAVFFQPTKAYNQSAFSPKAGIVYEIVKDKFSVFGNYQNSFRSNGYYTTDVDGRIALSDPERANQFEGGFKTNLINGKINATVSYYDIKVKNSLVATGAFTPSFQSVQTQAGKIESKGVELEVNAYLVKGFSVIGGIAYNDSEDVATGKRPVNSGSKWLTNFNASYQFLDGGLKGLGFGIGGNTASENNVTGDFFLPKFVVLNANAFYDTKNFRFGAKVDNFTNEHYWIGFTTANPQQLMNITGTFAYKF